MSTPVPALPPPAPEWLPGLDDLDLAGVHVVIGDQRPDTPEIESRRTLHLFLAATGSASLTGRRLAIAVAPGDEPWALALAAAFAAPQAPAAADVGSRALLALARRVGATPTSVLIEGPTGTGKEGLARLVHDASPRRAQPFVAVNCAALAEQMVEATLFGHERGAFTGAHAASPGAADPGGRGRGDIG